MAAKIRKNSIHGMILDEAYGDKSPRIVLRAAFELPRFWGDWEYGHVRVTINREVEFGNEYHGIGSVIGSYGRGPILDSIEVSAQFDYKTLTHPERTPEGWTYGWEVVAKPHHVTLEVAEAAVEVLGAIRKGMDKFRDEIGYPASFGQYVTRFARVAQIEHVVFAVDQDPTSEGRDHWCSGYKYRLYEAREAGEHIDWVLRKLREGAESGGSVKLAS